MVNEELQSQNEQNTREDEDIKVKEVDLMKEQSFRLMEMPNDNGSVEQDVLLDKDQVDS